MVSRRPFLFPVYKRHFVFLRWSLSICVGHTSCGLGAPQNVGMAAGISQICYSCQKLFLFPVYKCHLFFPVIIIYLRRAHILWIGRPRKYRNSRWNFTNILFLSEVISISGLQAPFCFFTVIIIYLCRTYIFWIGHPRKCRYSRWNFSHMLFLTEGLLFPVLGAILDFVCQSMTTHLHTRAKTMNKTRIWYQNLHVPDWCRTFLRHIFWPSISVHFRNFFVSHIAVPVKSDIKKQCQQHIQFRCPWKYKSSHWKCILLLMRIFRIGRTTFPRFSLIS